MRASRLVPALCLAALFLATAPGPAPAATWGDTLTTVMRPLPNLPTFVRQGEYFTVWALAPNVPTQWSASLRFASLVVPLELSSAAYLGSHARWFVDFRVPDGTPEETYDLVLNSDQTAPDTSLHAVRVVTDYPASFTFAQVSDTHLPTHDFSSDGPLSPADSSAIADFGAVIGDLNLIRPEFVLHTGDLVNEGELETHLGMYEMSQAQAALRRLEMPVFVVSGNHDLGGWQATAMPDGTARKNWWKLFGWPWLENPPAGDPHHSQDYSFDFGFLHVVGLEGYINNGGYDHYRQDIWGAQSFTAEQMSWLQSDLAGVTPGHAKLLFYHYDFGGTLPNGSPGSSFSQINPAALGVNGAIWGHNHGVAEGNRAAQPFNLGLQAVVDGRRTFRTFRFAGGQIVPGPMHKAGGSGSTPVDSLTAAWLGPNDGSRRANTVTVLNRYGETWTSPRLRFVLSFDDSTFTATGGTITQTIVTGGLAYVYVSTSFPAVGTRIVTVTPNAPVLGTPSPGDRSGAPALSAPYPNPFRPSHGAVVLRFTLPAAGGARLAIFDLAGRHVATPFEGTAAAGERTAGWDGRLEDGTEAPPGVYLARLEHAGRRVTARLVLLRD